MRRQIEGVVFRRWSLRGVSIDSNALWVNGLWGIFGRLASGECRAVLAAQLSYVGMSSKSCLDRDFLDSCVLI